MTIRSLTKLSFAVLMLAGLGLAACSSKKPNLPACPRVGILGDAQKGTQYRPGPGRDLTDVTFQTELLDYNGDCKFDDKPPTVTVHFVLQVAATRGPAATADEAQVPYFVAIVDKDRHVLARQAFVAHVPFKEGRRRVVVGEDLEQAIPLDGRSTSDIEVLVGLEISHQQLQQNRHERGF